LTDVGFLCNKVSGFCKVLHASAEDSAEMIENRFARRRGEDVFLPREFRDLGGEDQVLRVLRTLVREERLARHGRPLPNLA